MSTNPAIKVRRRISTLLLSVLTAIAALVLLGLVVMTIRLIEIQNDLAALRDSALPRLVKLSRLSQEASATISIAPALSAKPTRFEFETLLSRIKDKETSQRALIDEIKVFILDDAAAGVLGDNGDLLMANLRTLTDVVSQQIAVRKRLEKHVEYFRRMARSLLQPAQPSATIGNAASSVFAILSALFDPNSARYSRNKKQIEGGMATLAQDLKIGSEDAATGAETVTVLTHQLVEYWSAERNSILEDKQTELSNEFKIKSLVEENSLIANRLLSSANRAFWGASADLETQIGRVDETSRFTLVAILVVVVAFGVGILFVWLILKRRVFERLNRVGAALQAFADHRERPTADTSGDEIGAISDSLAHYMAVIDARESELAEKTNALEQLSNQLAKYLSPQVYDSIFSGKQEVKVASSRKKLTIFFSDIAGFTETADRMESEELTQLINHYLTEMSRIALEYGATIDKYVGDAILIFLGDPESKGVTEDALCCVKMAIAMQRRLNDLADTWRDTGIGKPLQVRMGIHTGFCTVGNFGSEDRMDYTIIGGAVNTASRLESVATPGEILISYETFALVRDEIHCKEHGEIDVKGIAYPIATYRVLDSFENLGRQQRHFREDHPNVKLDLNLDAMTKEDRSQAADILRQALASLSSEDEPTEPEQDSKPTPPRQS
jgi:class 3 adenylate cyclase